MKRTDLYLKPEEIINSIPPIRDFTPQEVANNVMGRWIRVMDSEGVQAVAVASANHAVKKVAEEITVLFEQREDFAGFGFQVMTLVNCLRDLDKQIEG